MKVTSRAGFIKDYNLGILNWRLTARGSLTETDLTTAIRRISKPENNSSLLLQLDNITEKRHAGHKSA